MPTQKESNFFVLDCSVTMAWCFENQVTNYTEKVFDSLKSTKAIVPEIWHLEVCNVLLKAERYKIITNLQAIEFIEALDLLPIKVDESEIGKAMHLIIEIAREFKLSAYDAAYLELAMRKKLPISTLDKALRKAANNAGVGSFLL